MENNEQGLITEEKERQIPCPDCDGSLNLGFSTKLGKVWLCSNYPESCIYIKRFVEA